MSQDMSQSKSSAQNAVPASKDRDRERKGRGTAQPPLMRSVEGEIESATTGLPASLLTPEQLRSVVESLLFVAGRPLELAELRRLLLVEETRLREAVQALAADCEQQKRGIRVQRLGTTVQFVSAPENARFVAALLGLPTQVKLTTAALETLAVVAYRQPITRSQIEFIRGVNSDRALSSLMQHALVSEVGRAGTVGRPMLFGTTPEFLQQFGLTSLEALPQPEAPRIRAAVGTGNEAGPGSAEG